MNITITDELPNGTITHQIDLEFSRESITAKELIEMRVTAEVGNYNKKQPELYYGLVEPTESEKALNGVKLKNRKLIDPEKQVYAALHAFQTNGFFILVDNQQVEELDQEIMLRSISKISFVKLTPLVGG